MLLEIPRPIKAMSLWDDPAAAPRTTTCRRMYGLQPTSEQADSSSNFAEVGGEAEHTLSLSEIPQHDHKLGLSDINWRAVKGSENPNAVFTGYGNAVQTTASGGGEPHNNMPPYIQVTGHVRAG